MGIYAQGITSKLAHKIHTLEIQNSAELKEKTEKLRAIKLNLEKKDYEKFDQDIDLLKKISDPFNNLKIPLIEDFFDKDSVLDNYLSSPKKPNFFMFILREIFLYIVGVYFASSMTFVTILSIFGMFFLFIFFTEDVKNYRYYLKQKDAVQDKKDKVFLETEKLINGDIYYLDILIKKYFNDAGFFDEKMPVFFSYCLNSSQTLTVDFDLPEYEFIPETYEKHDETGKIVIHEYKKSLMMKTYSNFIAYIPIIFSSYIFENFPSIENIIFSGYLDIKNEKTGKYEKNYFISTKIKRDIFTEIDFRRIDPITAINEFETRYEVDSKYNLKPVEPFYEDFMELKNINLTTLRHLNNIQFEKTIADLVEKMGYYIKQTKSFKDSSMEIIAEEPQNENIEKTFITVKKYLNKIEKSDVEKIKKRSDSFKCQKCMIITISDFESSAYKYSYENKIELINGKKLERLLK